MVSAAEGERLAVLETQMASVVADVSEIKTDVKQLMRVQTEQQLVLAAETAADKASRRSRADLGIWVRAAIPWTVAAVGVAIAALNLVNGS